MWYINNYGSEKLKNDQFYYDTNGNKRRWWNKWDVFELLSTKLIGVMYQWLVNIYTNMCDNI